MRRVGHYGNGHGELPRGAEATDPSATVPTAHRVTVPAEPLPNLAEALGLRIAGSFRRQRLRLVSGKPTSS